VNGRESLKQWTQIHGTLVDQRVHSISPLMTLAHASRYLRDLSLPHLNCGKSKPDPSISYALPSADPEARDVSVQRLGDESAEPPDRLPGGPGSVAPHVVGMLAVAGVLAALAVQLLRFV